MADRIENIDVEAQGAPEEVAKTVDNLRKAADDTQDQAIDDAHKTLAQIAKLEMQYEFSKLMPDPANASPDQVNMAIETALGIVQRDIGRHVDEVLSFDFTVNGKTDALSINGVHANSASIGADEAFDIARDPALRKALSDLPKEAQNQIINASLTPKLKQALLVEGSSLLIEMGGVDDNSRKKVIGQLNAIFRANTPEEYGNALKALNPDQVAALDAFKNTDAFKELKQVSEKMVNEAQEKNKNNPESQKDQFMEFVKKIIDLIGDIQMMLDGKDPSAPGVDDKRIDNDISRDKHLDLHKKNSVVRLKEVDIRIAELGSESGGGELGAARQMVDELSSASSAETEEGKSTLQKAKTSLKQLQEEQKKLETEQKKLEGRLKNINTKLNLSEDDGRENVKKEDHQKSVEDLKHEATEKRENQQSAERKYKKTKAAQKILGAFEEVSGVTLPLTKEQRENANTIADELVLALKNEKFQNSLSLELESDGDLEATDTTGSAFSLGISDMDILANWETTLSADPEAAIDDFLAIDTSQLDTGSRKSVERIKSLLKKVE